MKYVYLITRAEYDASSGVTVEFHQEATTTLEKAINVVNSLTGRRYNCQDVLADLQCCGTALASRQISDTRFADIVWYTISKIDVR